MFVGDISKFCMTNIKGKIERRRKLNKEKNDVIDVMDVMMSVVSNPCE